MKHGCLIYFLLSSVNLISRGMDISSISESPLDLEIRRVDCEIWLFDLFLPQFCKSGVKIWISQSISESLLDFEITRVDCISSVAYMLLSLPVSFSLMLSMLFKNFCKSHYKIIFFVSQTIRFGIS